MGNKDYTVVENEDGTRVRIVPKRVKNREFTEFDLPRRTWAGYHDSRPKRQRTRRESLRFALENEDGQ